MSWGGLGISGSPSSFFLWEGKSTQGSGIWVLTKDPTPLYPLTHQLPGFWVGSSYRPCAGCWLYSQGHLLPP